MSEIENRHLEAALYYLNKCNFSIIPAKTDKKPYIQWQEFQKQKPPESVVRKWWGEQYRFANIAIITGRVSGLTVIDVDTQAGKALLEDNLPELWQTPTVDTPGHGEHFYCKYEEGITNAVRFMDGCDIRSEGGYVIAPPSSDARGKWQWREGCKIGQIGISEIPLQVLTLIKSFSSTLSFKDSISKENITSTIQANVVSGQHLPTLPTIANKLNFNEGSRDDSLFHVANYLVRGGMEQGEVEYILMLIGLRLCNPPFPEKEILTKVKSAIQRVERRERNLTDEIRELISQQRGNITPTFCQQQLTIANKEDKKKVHTILGRMVKEGLLERTGRVAGEYRIVESEYDVVDAEKIQIEKALDISLPFHLEHYVEILSKDLIVIAGTPNAGKTALLLDLVARNQDRWECWYFSTEMGQQACARRIAQRDPSIKWKFKFAQGFQVYEDIIKPDCLNFIDYVEQNEGEAFKIPGILAKIQRKLRKGVAIVALQKNQGKGWAVGGEQTRAKPALFLSVEQQYPGQLLKIEKAKAFKDSNPNGFCMKFKIIRGINLRNESDWGPELA